MCVRVLCEGHLSHFLVRRVFTRSAAPLERTKQYDGMFINYKLHQNHEK